MRAVAKFEKVSFDQFKSGMDGLGFSDDEIKEMYENIKMPKRATTGSAGYDICTPFAITVKPGESIKIPTGLRCRIDEDYVLLIFPRSGLGFKFRFQLNNTVGVIDSDYYGADNEGHIFVKMMNDSNEGKVVELKAGDGFAQGIFMQYAVTEDDEADGVRTGGFGSTSK